MRRLLLLAVLLTAWGAAPDRANAQEPCPCTRAAASSFLNSPRAVRHYRTVFTQKMTWVDPAVVRKSRGEVKTRVYDWAVEGDFGFCKRNSKVCRAAKNCVIAGAAAYGSVLAGGGKERAADWAFAGACATAAVTTMLNP